MRAGLVQRDVRGGQPEIGIGVTRLVGASQDRGAPWNRTPGRLELRDGAEQQRVEMRAGPVARMRHIEATSPCSRANVRKSCAEGGGCARRTASVIGVSPIMPMRPSLSTGSRSGRLSTTGAEVQPDIGDQRGVAIRRRVHRAAIGDRTAGPVTFCTTTGAPIAFESSSAKRRASTASVWSAGGDGHDQGDEAQTRNFSSALAWQSCQPAGPTERHNPARCAAPRSSRLPPEYSSRLFNRQAAQYERGIPSTFCPI